jgi:hypothetical protein
MQIRFYKKEDYPKLIELYKKSDQFKLDEVTDSEEGIARKIEKDPESLLVAEENKQIVGSVSIIEDGRIALLFRLIASPTSFDKNDILKALVEKSESILKERGYLEMHNTAPTNDLNALMESKKINFKEGNVSTWFWKKIK